MFLYGHYSPSSPCAYSLLLTHQSLPLCADALFLFRYNRTQCTQPPWVVDRRSSFSFLLIPIIRSFIHLCRLICGRSLCVFAELHVLCQEAICNYNDYIGSESINGRPHRHYTVHISVFIVLKSCLNSKWDKSKCNLLSAYSYTTSWCIDWRRTDVSNFFHVIYAYVERHWAVYECSSVAAACGMILRCIRGIRCIVDLRHTYSIK